MKKSKFNLLVLFVAVFAVILTSCSKKMDPLTSDLFNADPSPLELVGTKVPVTINGRFPAKWFDKNAVVTITPVLKYNGGEVIGQSQTYQGEKVSGNAMVISQQQGGAITMRNSFDYRPELNESGLFLRFAVSKGDKVFDNFPDIMIAEGVMATAALADAYTTTPSYAPDAFQRIIKETHDANILFLIQRAELRSNELNKNSVEAWKNIVKEADENDRKKLNVEVSAYASPDGGYSLNDKLAGQREQNTSAYLKKELKRKGIDTDVNAHYTAQDWEGFKKLVEASNLQDKRLVLSVLSMYTDPAEREREIKNISAVYSELADNILPLLRRSRLIANVEIIGKTDAELREAIKQSSSDLSIEEILYVATLDGVDKENAYQQATRKYPNDYRGWNNLGSVYFQKGDHNRASENFNRARRLSTQSIEARMNLALFELAKNNVAGAEQELGAASGANNLNEALALVQLRKGEYKRAEETFGDAKTNNAAVAQILNQNYNKAKRTLDQVANPNATTDYLQAILAARTNNANGVVNYLQAAISKGIPTGQIAADREFARFKNNASFQNLIK